MSRWIPVIGLVILIPIIAVLVGLALRDGKRNRKSEAALRDEHGRRILPPNAPNMSVASLQAQINSVEIALQEHLAECEFLNMTEEEFVRVKLNVLDALKQGLPDEPQQQNH